MRQGNPLAGGHRSAPLRSDDRVLKPRGSWSMASFDLLKFLEERGYQGSPRAIAITPDGAEVVSYVEGAAASGTRLPDYVWTENALREVVQLLRHLHDLTTAWLPAHADWQSPPGAPAGDVICHNDAAPWNTIFRDGHVVAFVDWDAAGPGTPLWELGYVAWHWVPLWPNERAVDHGFMALEERRSRLAVIASSYGSVAPDAVLDAAADRQRAWHQQLREGVAAGIDAYGRLQQAGSEEGVLQDMRFLDDHRSELLATGPS